MTQMEDISTVKEKMRTNFTIKRKESENNNQESFQSIKNE
jgi:hypothetical protein